jgi:hypothetical protein
VQAPRWALDGNDDGMMDHPIDGGGGDDRVAEIISEFLEIDVGGDDDRSFAVATVDHLVKKRGVSGVMLFQSVEADLVDK